MTPQEAIKNWLEEKIKIDKNIAKKVSEKKLNENDLYKALEDYARSHQITCLNDTEAFEVIKEIILDRDVKKIKVESNKDYQATIELSEEDKAKAHDLALQKYAEEIKEKMLEEDKKLQEKQRQKALAEKKKKEEQGYVSLFDF